MYVTTQCPFCRLLLEVEAGEVGIQGQCPDCEAFFTVRQVEEGEENEDPPIAPPPHVDDDEPESLAHLHSTGKRPGVSPDQSSDAAEDDPELGLDLDDALELDLDLDLDLELDESEAVEPPDPAVDDGGETVPSLASAVPIAKPVSNEDLQQSASEGAPPSDDDCQDHNAPPTERPSIIADPAGTAPPSRRHATLEAGARIGGFEVGPLLGSGAMGQVYLARQVSMDREVALKILPEEIMSRDDDAVKQFLNEVRMLAKLDHPNIVTAFEAGNADGVHYLAMSCVNGESLEQRLRREPVLPEDEALASCLDVALALQHAWDRFKLLHRDIKPANVMIDGMGEVKLMDMGIAKISTDEEGASSIVMGTPYYMSPEQATGKAGLDWRTDQYSLAATMFMLLTGRTAFTGKNAMEIMTKQAFEPLVPPREFNPAISAATNELICRMMEKNPDDRFNDWADVIAAIEANIQKLKDKRRRPKGDNHSESAGSEPSAQAKSKSLTRTPARRRGHGRRRRVPAKRGPGAAVYVVGLIIIFILIYLLIGAVNRSGALEPYRLPQDIFPKFLQLGEVTRPQAPVQPEELA